MIFVLRILRRIALLFLFLTLALTTGLGFLLYSDTGTRWTLERLAALAGDRAGFDQVRGSLAQGLTLVEIRVRADAAVITIGESSLRWEPARVLEGRLEFPEIRLHRVDIRLQSPDAPPAAGSQPRTLPDRVPVPMELDIGHLGIDALRIEGIGQTPILIDTVELSAEVSQETLTLRKLRVATPDADLNASGTVGLGSGFPLRLEGGWRADLPTDLALYLRREEARGELRLEGELDSELRIRHHIDAGIVVESEIGIRDPVGFPRFDSLHAWSALELTRPGGPVVGIAPGTLELEGDRDAWRAELDTAISAEPGPAADLTAVILGTREALTVEPLRIQVNGGEIEVEGRLELLGTLPFEFSASARGVDLAAFGPEEWPRIDALRLQVRGDHPTDPARLQVTFALEELAGRLAGQALELSGRAGWDSGRLDLEAIDVVAGRNQLRVNGRIGEELDLDWALSGPELDRLIPGFGGQVHASGELTGSRTRPRITASAQLENLLLDDLRVREGRLDIDAGAEPRDPFRIDAELHDALLGSTAIARIALRVEGAADAHRITLETEALDRLESSLIAEGRYSPEAMQWTGRLSDLDLRDADLGSWRLARPVEVTASPDAAGIGPLCLTQERARICTEGTWEPDTGGQMTGSVDGYDLDRLDFLWPETLRVSGVLAGDFTGGITPEGRVTAGLDLRPSSGRLGHAGLTVGEEAEPLPLDYRDLRLTVRLDDGALAAAMGVDFSDLGSVSANIDARLDEPDVPLSGRGRVILQRLDWIPLMTDAVENPQGRIQADLRLEGTLTDPRPSGEVHLVSLQAGVPVTGRIFELPLLSLVLDEDGNGQFSGEIRSGDTGLVLTGDIHSGDDGLAAKLNVYGLDFHAVEREDLQAWISPNLELNWRTGDPPRIRGSIVVPRLHIVAPQLPEGAVAVSADEYFPGEDTTETPAGPTLDLRLRVILGEDVRFTGYGLESTFSGDIDLIQPVNQPLQAFGEIRIREGRYRAYGQDLRIADGSVIFRGPVEDPALDIRAERRIRRPEVIVGVEIGGTASELRSSLFSEPPMDDTEALSFLLTGRPLGASADRNTGQLLARAAATWGLDQAAVITERLGQDLGLSELALDTESEEFEGGALVVGQRLSPRLLLRYSIGLFETGRKISLQYELTESLRLETSSTGETQEADLIYRIER